MTLIECDWAASDGGVRCKRCGVTHDSPVRRRCRLPGEVDQEGLGDWVEAQLQKIGVTKESYASVKQLFGFAPTCDCDTRKDWLNKVSEWWRTHS